MKKIEDGIFPSDLKNASLRELDLLCYEIRDKLISNVSKTGGHLASNLGVVELTVALHRVFDTPRDRIVWDVGHQTYVHKMLTGRGARLMTLRQQGGLSGFPKQSESPYDTFDTGHSSNSISAALGMAAARDLNREDYEVVAVIGDGALTGGMAYEALNNAGDLERKLIVILNDNAMSIAPNRGGMSRHLTRLRTSRKYNHLKDLVRSGLNEMPGSTGDRLYSGLHSIKDAMKYMTVPGVVFEEMGLTYLGPVDGHDLEKMIEVLEAAKKLNEPVVVHCITEKGKGYRPAEQHPEDFHGVSAFDPTTGVPVKKSTGKSYSAVFGETLTEMAEQDDRIVAISAAMVDGTGLSGFAETFPDRMFDVGIAEEHAVTFAAGLAVCGRKPAVAVYSTFLQRAYDQILIDVCMQGLPVVFCIDRAGIVGADGETHHGVFDLSYLSPMPGMTILAPSDAGELKAAMKYAWNLDGPCAIRYPRGQAPEPADRTEEWKPMPYVFRHGKDITLVGVGKMTNYCLEAAELLKPHGIEAGVIDARILKPLPEAAVSLYRSIGVSSGRVLVVEDNVTEGGFGSTVESLFASEARPAVQVVRAGWPDRFVSHGTQAELEHEYRLDAGGIAKRVMEILGVKDEEQVTGRPDRTETEKGE